jgi:uncharacterized membrane protein
MNKEKIYLFIVFIVGCLIGYALGLEKSIIFVGGLILGKFWEIQAQKNDILNTKGDKTTKLKIGGKNGVSRN